MTSVLVVEDDANMLDMILFVLSREGYRVRGAVNGQEALEEMDRSPADLVVLDVMMPVMDGWDLCRELRRISPELPIIMITAKHETSQKVKGFDLGADDYLVKPFALEELFARVRALLRRAAPPPEAGFADLVLLPDSRQARRGRRLIDLTRTEYALLDLLIRNGGQVLTRQVILERIWGYGFRPGSNPLEVYIGYLRKKTEAGGEPRLIHTVHGLGYTLREPTASPAAGEER